MRKQKIPYLAFLLVFFLALPSCLFAASSQDAALTSSSLPSLSSQIHEQLLSLKSQAKTLNDSLILSEAELQMSELKVKELQTELTDLSTSLTNTNQKLTEYSTKLLQYEQKLKFRAKLLWIALLILLAALAVRAVLLILKIKFGISIPYWLNLLL